MGTPWWWFPPHLSRYASKWVPQHRQDIAAMEHDPMGAASGGGGDSPEKWRTFMSPEKGPLKVKGWIIFQPYIFMWYVSLLVFKGGNGKCNPGRMQVAGWFLGSMAKKTTGGLCYKPLCTPFTSRPQVRYETLTKIPRHSIFYPFFCKILSKADWMISLWYFTKLNICFSPGSSKLLSKR